MSRPRHTIAPFVSDDVVYEFSRRCVTVLVNLLSRPRVYGIEHIPRAGPLLIAANHSSYLDPIYVGATAPRDVFYMAKRSLFVGPLPPLWRAVHAFPVERGAPDIGALRAAMRLLKRGKAVLMFPEGSRSAGRDTTDARKGVGFLSTRTAAPVLPIYMEGVDRVLGRGQRWFRRSQVDIYIGSPLFFSRDVDIEEASRQVLLAIRALRENRGLFRLDCPWALG